MNGSLDVLQALLSGLQIGGIFFCKPLWSILFGVAVTAAIDVFVDKDQMTRFLGGRDLKTIGVATATGAAWLVKRIGDAHRLPGHASFPGRAS